VDFDNRERWPASAPICEEPTVKLTVGNLDFEASEDAVPELFRPFDSVETVEIAPDWETGHSRGLAFVHRESGMRGRAGVRWRL